MALKRLYLDDTPASAAAKAAVYAASANLEGVESESEHEESGSEEESAEEDDEGEDSEPGSSRSRAPRR